MRITEEGVGELRQAGLNVGYGHAPEVRDENSIPNTLNDILQCIRVGDTNHRCNGTTDGSYFSCSDVFLEPNAHDGCLL
jgi:hypothetical protein